MEQLYKIIHHENNHSFSGELNYYQNVDVKHKLYTCAKIETFSVMA